MKRIKNINKDELKRLKQADLSKIRSDLHKEQKNICPIMKQEFPLDIMVVDHQHRRSSEEIGENGAGLIRGVIHRQANVLEGKIVNAFYRYGLHKFISLPDFLRNLADYLELDKYPMIHPEEVSILRKKEKKKLQKNSYNKLVKKLKEIGYRGKIPPYPRNEYLTKALFLLYNKAGLLPEYYSK